MVVDLLAGSCTQNKLIKAKAMSPQISFLKLFSDTKT